MGSETLALGHAALGKRFRREVGGSQFLCWPGLDPGGPPRLECVLGFLSPTESEIDGFEHSIPDLALSVAGGVPFVCLRFIRVGGGVSGLQRGIPIGWQEMPVHPLAAQGRYVPAPPAGSARWPVSAYLVDTGSQAVVAVRDFSVRAGFARALSHSLAISRSRFSGMADYQGYLAGEIHPAYPAGSIVAKGRLLARALGEE